MSLSYMRTFHNSIYVSFSILRIYMVNALDQCVFDDVTGFLKYEYFVRMLYEVFCCMISIYVLHRSIILLENIPICILLQFFFVLLPRWSQRLNLKWLSLFLSQDSVTEICFLALETRHKVDSKLFLHDLRYCIRSHRYI